MSNNRKTILGMPPLLNIKENWEITGKSPGNHWEWFYYSMHEEACKPPISHDNISKWNVHKLLNQL